MYSINQDKSTGVINVVGSFVSGGEPQFSKIGDTYVESILNLETIETIKSFDFNSTGTNNSRYLDSFYRISRDDVNWSDWLSLSDNITNFPPWDPKDHMYLDIKWERVGTSTAGVIKLSDYLISGSLSRQLFDGEGTIVLDPKSNYLIIKPPFIYKVFKITDLEILSKGDISNLIVKYRFSQDYGRTVSQWEYLTKDNITTIRINPIRFFQIEYLLEYSGSSTVRIFDINLIGDFQNVTMDSQKTNLYGVRENCSCLMLGITNGVPDAGSPSSEMITGSSCNNPLSPLTQDDISKLYKPYQQTQAVNLLNQLSTGANEMFGHEVVYFITDPDKKGTDYTFHEYQLYNFVCSDIVKVSVDGNNFPDNQISMNQFDLSLFDSFEIHIPKETFKSSFGVDKRPSKEDFLWFCEINRMFQVEHAQQFRSFNNTALYYKVMLKKYVQKSNIIGANQTIADKVKELTKNSTIDELFGLENMLDKKDVANKEQLRPLTRDVLRLEVNIQIDKELIENSTTIISKSNYDLSTIPYSNVAVTYRNFRSWFKPSDNFSFFLWFNIHNYTVNDTYNFINYYDESNILGFKINLESDNIIFTLNSDEYRFKIGTFGNADALIEDVWYCYLINVDQRQRKVNQYIYKRNVDEESQASMLGSTVLKKVYSQEDTLSIVNFEIETTHVTLLASDMKATNLRLFNGVIPESEHNKLLNQYIIGTDYKYLIFADNANTRLTLPNYQSSQIDNDIVRGEFKKEDTDEYPIMPPIPTSGDYVDPGYEDDGYV